MRLIPLLTLSLCFAAAGCADHNAAFKLDSTTPTNGSQPNNPDELTRVTEKDKLSEVDQPPEVPTEYTGDLGQQGGNPGNGTDGGDGTDGGEGGQPVPEPSTLLLVGTGLAGVAILRRRRKNSTAT